VSEQELTLVASSLQFFSLSTYKSMEYDEDKTRGREEETIKADETEAEMKA
jgi:dsRNA-specific ribonuclease